MSLALVRLLNLDQGLFYLLLVSQTNRKVITPGAPHPWPLEEMPCDDLMGHELGLGQVLHHLIGCACRGMPLDLGRLRLDEHTEGTLLGFWLCQLVGRELIGHVHLMLPVRGGGGLEIHDRVLSVQVRDEVNNAHERKLKAGDVERKRSLGCRDVSDFGEFLLDELLEERLADVVQLLPGISCAIGEVGLFRFTPGLQKDGYRITTCLEEVGQSLVHDLAEHQVR